MGSCPDTDIDLINFMIKKNALAPEFDLHLISPYNITHESISEMITN